MQLDIFDLAVCAVIRQFDLLGVQNNRVLDFAVIQQAHVNALMFFRLHFAFYFLIETRSPPGLLAPTVVAYVDHSVAAATSRQLPYLRYRLPARFPDRDVFYVTEPVSSIQPS